MGHLVGKDIYKKVGRRLENLLFKAPWNDKMYAIVKELYTLEEAEFFIQLPSGIADIDKLVKITKYDKARVLRILDSLCQKGLVMDIEMYGKYHYVISPFVIGFFEATMMRMGNNLNTKEWARLFYEYINTGALYDANFSNGEVIGFGRVLPHENAFSNGEYTEVLSYEKAKEVLKEHTIFGIGTCSCRHEKIHAGTKECDHPLDTCASMGDSADYFIRRNMAKKVTLEQMLESIDRAREEGLVLISENMKKDVGFICQCCGCCCNMLRGITEYGYENAVVTSDYIACIDTETCVGCGKCVTACHVKAITMKDDADTKKKIAEVDESACIGCGVCVLKCNKKSLVMKQKEKRVYVPEDFLEKILTGALERDVLHHLVFNDPNKLSFKFLRGVAGAFLRLPPIKKALMGEKLKSKFLNKIRELDAQMQNQQKK